MPRILLTIAYDGTDFCGYQWQPKQRTVQSALEESIKQMFNKKITTFASGRTDSGVHARAQTLHFDVDTSIPAEKIAHILNKYLPADIVAQKSQAVAIDFHARYNDIKKTYSYLIDTRLQPDVFLLRYSLRYPYKLNTRTMRIAAQHLIGEHDFSSFCSNKSAVENKTRKIHQLDIINQKGLIKIIVSGNGFLYNMVRIIASALIEVGAGRIAIEDINNILAARDRRQAPRTAAAHGLTLEKVEYR